MNQVIELLQQSKRPLFLLGGGARSASTDILDFADEYGIPVQTTWNAVDLVPSSHRMFAGRPGMVATRDANFILQNCDLLIAVGARLDEPTIAYDYSKLTPKAKRVLVDIDTGESLKIPNLDVFVHADAKDFIKQLMEADYPCYPFWWVDYVGGKLEGDTITYKLLDELNNHLPADSVFVMDCGCMAVNMFCAGFKVKEGQRFIMSSCGLGSMGASIPVAIGAAIASKKHVYVVCGDGSFMQNVQELEVIHRLNLPITIFVISNGGYASIRASEMRAFGRTASGETIPSIKYVAQAFGIKAVGMPEAFLFNWKLLQSDDPQVIEFYAPIDEQPLPRVFPNSGSLERMYPYE